MELVHVFLVYCFHLIDKYLSDLVKKIWSTIQINIIDIDRKTHPEHQPVPPLRPQQLQTLGFGSTIENFAPVGKKYFHSLGLRCICEFTMNTIYTVNPRN